jgi:hypothetical protein
MPTSTPQLDSVKRQYKKKKAEGHFRVAATIDPGTKAALDYLRQNRPGGFNLTAQLQSWIMSEAIHRGFKPD